MINFREIRGQCIRGFSCGHVKSGRALRGIAMEARLFTYVIKAIAFLTRPVATRRVPARRRARIRTLIEVREGFRFPFALRLGAAFAFLCRQFQQRQGSGHRQPLRVRF